MHCGQKKGIGVGFENKAKFCSNLAETGFAAYSSVMLCKIDLDKS